MGPNRAASQLIDLSPLTHSIGISNSVLTDTSPRYLEALGRSVGTTPSGSRLALLMLMALLAAGCASLSSSDAPKHPDPEETETWGEVSAENLVYPAQLGQFSLAEIDDASQVELGVRLKYADTSLPQASIDVYVYPITKQETASLAHVLEWEMESVAEGIATVARRNGLRAGEPGSFPFSHSTADLPPGLGLVLLLSSPDNDQVSYAFISVRDHHFFKLRVTLPTREVDSGRQDYLQEVLDVLYPAVHLRSPAQPPDLGVTVYANVFLAPQHEACNLSGWMIYGVEMLKQIQSGKYMDTFERELSARKSVLNYWVEKQEDGEACASDVLEAMSSAEAAGFLDEYVFQAYGRGRWPDRDELNLEEWSAWSNDNLKHHDPVVDTGVAVDWKSPQDGLLRNGPSENDANR